MLKRIWLTLPALMLGLAAGGVQADPSPTRIVNPNGSVVEVCEFGNEFFSFFTDINHKILYEYDGEGNIVPAIREGRNLLVNKDDIDLLKKATLRKVNNIPTRAVFNIADDGRSAFPTQGKVKSLIILVEYPECPFAVENPQELFTRKCNEKGFSDYGGCGSVKDYFEANSHGRFSPSFDVYGPVKLPESSKYYTGGYRMQKFYEAVGYAVKELDDEIDFSQYDNDGDGLVDTIFFYFAGHGQNDTKDTSLIWPHQWDYRKYVSTPAGALICDGVEIGPYACSSELKSKIPDGEEQPWMDGIGTHVHEFSHVFGLPDLYDTDGGSFFSTTSPEDWSVMDHGNYLGYSTCPVGYSAYEQYFCRWLDSMEEMTPGEEYSLASNSNTTEPKAYYIRVPKSKGSDSYYNEWFFFETRTRHGWDAQIPEEGMLIWRIDFDRDAWTDNKVNINRKPHWELLSPDSYNKKFTWPGEKGESWYLCPEVTTTLKPSNTSKDFNVILDDIRYDAATETVTFGYNRITERPATTTFLKNPWVDHDLRNIYLTWEPVEGADDYLVTVTCYDEDNWLRTVNGFSEKSSGGNNYVTIENVMEKFWKFEMTATVRVVEKIPSSNISNSVKFTPESVKETEESGMDNVNVDIITVYGTTGEIIAPEGSVVYDLQGRSRGLKGLEKGIYIVTSGNRAFKVRVD